MTLRRKLRPLASAGLAAASCILLVSACGTSSPAPAATSIATPAALPSSPAAASPATEVTPGPLTLAHFPSTTDGKLARDECEQWVQLRAEYYSRVQNDTPYQLNQWFSSSDWAKEINDSYPLGADPDYSNIETAFAGGLVGDMASVASARQIDRACAAGD
jgi:hypothetical protein